VHRIPLHNTFSTTLSAPAAEEQFLEQNPWANAQHPVHKLGMSRQNSNRSPLDDSMVTPANRQRLADNSHPIGSASTILENPSAPVSSAMNTPHDLAGSQTRLEQQNFSGNRLPSTSPMDGRRVLQNNIERPASLPREPLRHDASSPLSTRPYTLKPTMKDSPAHLERIPRHNTASPFGATRPGGITAGTGKFSVR